MPNGAEALVVEEDLPHQPATVVVAAHFMAEAGVVLAGQLLATLLDEVLAAALWHT